ncbi:MAG: HAD family hydrolase [Candidatus Aphodosoma sp.]
MDANKRLLSGLQHYMRVKGYDEFNPKAVFFDMDGVLFDSMPYHARAWTAVMTAHGVPFGLRDAYMHEGRTGADTINEFFLKYKGRKASEDELLAVYDEKSALFASIQKVKRIDGVADLMVRLRYDGLQTYLVTGSGQKSLLDTLEIWFPGFFDRTRMVTAFDVVCGKPDPEPYIRALAKSGLKPNEVFVVENAPLGVRSAVSAGLFTAAVNTGILGDEVLDAECRDSGVVFRDMRQLLQEYMSLPGRIAL